MNSTKPNGSNVHGIALSRAIGEHYALIEREIEHAIS
jgi:hypothetical protein